MAKTYAPIKIKNPIACNHLVFLYPNQDLVVSLSDNQVKVKENSDLLGLERVEYSTWGVSYNYKQRMDLEQWAMVSSVYLGNIEIVCGNVVSSLCVLLHSTNPCKKSVITAINPVRQTLKLEPYSILEVVVFGAGRDQWDCFVSGGDICMENVCRREIALGFMVERSDFNKLFYAFPRQDFKDASLREYHYWFRYDKRSIDEIENMGNGTYSGGNITFFNHLEETNKLNLLVNVRKKNKDKLHSGLYCPNYTLSNYLPASIPTRTSINKRQLFVRDVQLTEIKNCTMESNCRVIDLDC